MVETLHEKGNTGQAGLDPDHLELRKALGHPVHDPVGHVDEVVDDEAEGVHPGERVERLHPAVAAPGVAGVEAQRQAAFLKLPVQRHIGVLMHGAVARGSHHEADDARQIAEVAHHRQRRRGIAEGQVEHRLDPGLGGQHAFGDPARVGPCQSHLDLGLWVQAEVEHRRREQDLNVDPDRVHRPQSQDKVALLAVLLPLLGPPAGGA